MDVSNSTGQDTGYRVIAGGGVGGTRGLLRRGKRLYRLVEEGVLKAYTYTSVAVSTDDQPCVVEFFKPGGDKPLTCSHHVPWPAKGAAMAESALDDDSAAAVAEAMAKEEKPASPGAVEVLVALVQNGNGTPSACACRKAARGPGKGPKA